MSETQRPLNEKVRLIRWRMSKEKLRFSDELRLIPRWIWVLDILIVLAAQVVAQIVRVYEMHSTPPLPALIGIALGAAFGFDLLLTFFAYVNRDAERRGMNSTLWTLLAIFVPYLIGLIAYFLVREPLPFPCPQCGATVSARFNYCPSCKHNLRPNCSQCKREVRIEDKYCPYCAYELARNTALAVQEAAPRTS